MMHLSANSHALSKTRHVLQLPGPLHCQKLQSIPGLQAAATYVESIPQCCHQNQTSSDLCCLTKRLPRGRHLK